MLYLVLGSVLFAISTEPSLSLATGIAPRLGSPLHLLTAGFLVLTAFGVGLRMFAAFSAAEPPPAAAWVLVVFGVPAPAGIAIGISYTSNALLAVSAASALAAAATFLVVILHYWRRQRRRRAAWWLLVAAAAMLVAGEALGGLFAFDPRLRVNLIAVHAQVNVIGFGGLLIFGVLFALSGGRAARPGTIPPGISIAVVWPAALGLRLVGAALGLSALAAAGAIAILATLVLAARDARPPGTRVPPGQAAA
jgi:hypothetical protein